MNWTPRQPRKLEAETREAERAVIAEIEELHGRTANVCPECGSTNYHHVDGCMVCQSCGFSPCGV
ncbi:MAG: hypothetical protein LBJ36_11120 [Synergistaceae bacterium]|nr:hypothetical protein [Synergistaceae bacterium]